MRKYKKNQLNRFTDQTYTFFKYILDMPITSKILRLAADINEATNNEIAMALILSNKCNLFGEELQYFDGTWGDTANAESNLLENRYDNNVIMRREYIKEDEEKSDEYQTAER